MNNQDYYNKEYVPQINKIGKITGYLGVLLSFTPPNSANPNSFFFVKHCVGFVFIVEDVG